MMGSPLGVNGILTIPYIILASQNLIRRDIAWNPKVDYSQVQSNIDHDTCFIVHPNSQNSLDSLHTESMGLKSFSVMWRIANATCEKQT